MTTVKMNPADYDSEAMYPADYLPNAVLDAFITFQPKETTYVLKTSSNLKDCRKGSKRVIQKQKMENNF